MVWGRALRKCTTLVWTSALRFGRDILSALDSAKIHTDRHFLQIPGPANCPDRILRAMDHPVIDHRGPEFAELALEVLDEHYLFCYKKLYGLPCVVLRYGNVYGPRQSSEGKAGVVAIFSEQIMAGITPKIYGDGSKTCDYGEVSDIARANIQALEHGDNGNLIS